MTDSSADRIVKDLRAWIDEAPAGARLPSSRELAARYGASPVTVQRATRTLVGLGLIESRPGAGNFVLGTRTPKPLDFGWQTAALRSANPVGRTSSTPLRDTAADSIGLHSGYPDRELLPERVVRSALVRAARGDAALLRPPVHGAPDLRAWF
ncbi:MAG: GntR family transcriptional regulator, partial [Gordonia sp. (in: high G+C Gram-positive bacteria)]